MFCRFTSPFSQLNWKSAGPLHSPIHVSPWLRETGILFRPPSFPTFITFRPSKHECINTCASTLYVDLFLLLYGNKEIFRDLLGPHLPGAPLLVFDCIKKNPSSSFSDVVFDFNSSWPSWCARYTVTKATLKSSSWLNLDHAVKIQNIYNLLANSSLALYLALHDRMHDSTIYSVPVTCFLST